MVVHIWVQDNGIGISLEDQKKIFQKFFRSDRLKSARVSRHRSGPECNEEALIEMMGRSLRGSRTSPNSARGQPSTSPSLWQKDNYQLYTQAVGKANALDGREAGLPSHPPGIERAA